MDTACVKKISTETDVFLELSCFFHDPVDVGNLISGSSAFSTQEMWVLSLGQEDPLEEGMATESSVLAWRIPGMGEPGWAAVYGVVQSRTRLKRLSSSSSSSAKWFGYDLAATCHMMYSQMRRK